jgi:excisionase family DNA binding protein
VTLLTVAEAAQQLRLHRATIYRKIARGVLPAVRTGDRRAAIRIDQDELTRWLYDDASQPDA